MHTDGSGPPLVSIGIPVRNGAATLARAIESALAQDYPALEVVICDNASTDATAEIAAAFAARDPRVRVERNPVDIGAQRNFGRAVAAARGTYFAWLAHDDELVRPDAVGLLAAVLDRHPDVAACGSSIIMSEVWDETRARVISFPELAPDRPWSLGRRAFFRWPQDLCHFMVYGLFRRALLEAVPFGGRLRKGRRVVSDLEYSILLPLAVAHRLVAIEAPLRRYLIHPRSASLVELALLSGWDRFVLGLQVKRFVLAQALAVRAPWAQRAGLLALALRNFLVANLRRPTDYAVMFAAQKRELRRLRDVCDERLAAIARLDDECRMLRGVCAERLALIERLDGECRALQQALASRDAVPPGRTPAAAAADD